MSAAGSLWGLLARTVATPCQFTFPPLDEDAILFPSITLWAQLRSCLTTVPSPRPAASWGPPASLPAPEPEKMSESSPEPS